MRIFATGLLVVMALIFLALRQFEGPHPGWGYAIAFTEAAMVGGLADWFAVTALFRHPLGIPIPHTAIIPVNKDRIADTMAAFLRENFLTPPVVTRRLYGFNFAAGAGEFLADSQRAEQSQVRAGVTNFLADMLQSLNEEQLGGLVKSGLRQQLKRIDLSPLAGQILGHAIADRRHIPVLEGLLIWIGRTLEENEELVRALIHQQAPSLMRWTGLDERLANRVLDGLYGLLAEVAVQPHHPLRGKFEEGLEQLAWDLVNNAKMQADVERMKHEILDNPAMVKWIDSMWERAREAMLRALRNPDTAFAGGLGDSFAHLGVALSQDERLQLLVNRFARRTLVGAITRYGGEIVRIVSETVKRWDARTVTDRIEGAVGRDLQFIRVNGTLVGGMVGLAIHAVDGWL